MTYSKPIGIVLSVFLLAGCGVTEGDRAYTSTDAWYLPPPGQIEFIPLDSQCFAPVDDLLQKDAQAALANVSAKRITAAEAARL